MRKSLLLVEDNPEMLEILVQCFKDAYDVVTARNGLEAIQKAEEASPSLVVLDLMLPEMDGFQVCEVLRNHPGTCRIPILILTGMPGELTRLTSLDSGGTDFMTKPFVVKDLTSKVRLMLSSTGFSAEPA